MRNPIPNKKNAYLHRLYGISEQDMLQVHSSAPEKLRMAQLDIAEGQLLQLIIRLSNVRKIVEVGTCVGFSAICMAKCIPEDGHIYTIEKNYENVSLARQNIINCAMSDKISVLHGHALTELRSLESESPFDMIFIDADKSSYHLYLEWAESNIKKGGIIAADNSFLFGTVLESEPSGNVSAAAHKSMCTFNTALSNKEKYLCSLLPYDEGLTLAMKLF